MAALAQANNMNTDKADKFVKQANAKLNKANGFICLDRNGTKDEAAQLFKQAAVQYKIIKMYELAGDSYVHSAEIYVSIDDMISAKISWKDAAKSYKHIGDYDKTISCNLNAIQIDLDSNKINQAGKLQKEIGDIYIENDEIKNGILSYQKSIEYYQMEHDQQTQINKIYLIIANLYGSIKQKRWIKSAKIFEDVAKIYIDNNLLRWKVRELLFKSSLLRICSICDDDTIKGAAKWSKMDIIHSEYCDITQIYSDSRESRLINEIIGYLKVNDRDSFCSSVGKYDNMNKLDSWCMDLVDHINEYMKNAVNHFINGDVFDQIENGFDPNENQVNEDNNNNGNQPLISAQPDPFDQNPSNEEEIKNAPILDEF